MLDSTVQEEGLLATVALVKALGKSCGLRGSTVRNPPSTEKLLCVCEIWLWQHHA